MKKWFQIIINLLVVSMFCYFFVYPFIQSFSTYEEYEDGITPDEILLLDEEIYEILEKVEPNFGDLYENRSIDDSYSFRYLNQNQRKPLKDNENYLERVASVVYITSEDSIGDLYIGAGSILTTDGVIMTNFHNLEGASKVVITTKDGAHYLPEKVIASDEILDIMFLKIDAENLQPLPIGNSDGVEVGDKTLVIGHSEGFVNTLSVGNVSGIRNYESQGIGSQIQITNPISLGNSGGVLLNEFGEILGIPTWSVEYDQNVIQVQNLNFAVPVNQALSILENY